MTTMTLRVASVQGGCNGIVRSECKEMCAVTVAGNHINGARKIDETEGTSVGAEIENLLRAATIEQQLHILKDIAKKHLGNGSSYEKTKVSAFCIQLLVDLYVTAVPKNPLKCAISRIFMTLPDEGHIDVAVCLSAHLNKLMTLDGNLDEMNAVIIVISCCFDNFPIGVHAVTISVLPVLRLMKTCLKCCLMELSLELSPSKKMEVCKIVHSAVRTSVSLLQKCQTEIKELVYSESGYKQGYSMSDVIVNLAALLDVNCKLTPGSTDYSEFKDGMCHAVPVTVENPLATVTLSSLLELVATLMGCSDLPLDTQSNCGMLLVLLIVVLDSTGGEWFKGLENQEVPWKVDLSAVSFQLNVCTGMLNALSTSELCCVHTVTGEPVINFIFHRLFDISKRSTADSGMVLGVSRALHLLSRKLLSTAIQLKDVSVVDDMLEFVWTHLEHYMDSVRHSASGILLNLVKLGSSLKQDGSDGCNVLSTIVETVMTIPVHSKSRYIGLAVLADEIGCQVLIDQIPDLVQSLLNSLADPTLTTHVSSAVEHLMLRHIAECEEDIWRALWIVPILEMLSHASTSLCGPLQALLSTSVSHYPRLLTHILQPIISDTCPKATHLRTVLSCIRLARKQGALDDQSEFQHCSTLWKGVLDVRILEQTLYHRDVEIRMSAFSLLAESHRSTETFSVSELQLVRKFLEYNINCEIPSSRQQTLSLLKKILTRLRDSARVLCSRKGENKTSKKKIEPDSNRSHLLRTYNSFVLWLLEFSFDNLFPGANFRRRGSSLQILTLCHEILSFDAAELVWTPCPPVVYTQSYANILLECLKDTYENNKMLALRLLITFPAEALGLDDPDQVSSLIGVSLQLASSHSPPDCITAAYLLRVLVKFHQTGVVLAAMQECDERSCTDNSTVYLAIHLLVHRLSAELAEANHSILIAAASGPMYGILFCIRQLLSDVSFTSIAGENSWCSLIGEVVDMCFRLCEVVGPIVNSSSPEGHLPMDFQPGMQHLKQDSASDISELPVLNVTAQMVLLCAWRTVKEVSLFLGELSEQAPISSAEDSDECHGKSLLTEEQVLTIGSHLAMLLVETKHRGAFEQAYVGFCKLCGRLWRHPSARLHNLPRLWMKELMDIITWGKGTKLCATRRSAGLPFMVQAFLTTELQVGGNTSCFRQSMAALLELADVTDNRAGARRSINAISGTATEDSVGNSTASDPSNIAENFKILYVSTESSDCVDTVEARIHALNILRSLFRHSVLGESVTPYIAQGVIVAIQGFKGKTWAERNSATLLFSALVTRIFGVHRSREELSIRNRMTGRIFFLRYPSLYEFLLEELKEAIASMEECYSSLQPGLFPVLLLLSRLYPSSLEGTDSNLQLSVYAPFVHRCSLSSVLKTRALAAKALVPLVPPNQHPLLLQELVTISAQKYTTENHRHGLLLQIFHLLEESLSALSVSKEVAERVEQWIVDLKWLLPSETGFQICFVTSEVFLRILHIVSRRLFMSVSHSVWQEICNVLSVDLLRSQEEVPSRMIGRGIYLHHAVQLLLELSLVLHPTHTPTPSFLKDMEQLLVHLLFHARYEVVKIALSFLEALLDTGDYILEDEEDSTLPVDKSFYRHVKEWNRSHEGVLADSLRSSPAIGEILVRQMVPKEQSTFAECCWKTFCVLSHCPKALLRMETAAEGVLRGLLQRCQKECEGIDWAVLRCAGALVKIMQQENVPLTAEVTSEVCCTLVEFSSTDKSSTCRLTVANILLDNTSWLQGTMTFLSALDVCTLWTVVMTLLDDECSHVRELISSLAMHFGCTKFPVMPQRAKDLLVEYFVHVMINLDALMCVVCLVAWCLMSPGNDCDSGLLEDRVFDKGEMNEFAETVTVTEVACGQLKNLLCREDRTQLLETHLPGKVKDWLLHMCRTDMSTMSDRGESHTLAEFIKEADRRAVFSTGDSHFLCVNPRTEILTVFKTKKLMEAVHGSLGSK